MTELTFCKSIEPGHCTALCLLYHKEKSPVFGVLFLVSSVNPCSKWISCMKNVTYNSGMENFNGKSVPCNFPFISINVALRKKVQLKIFLWIFPHPNCIKNAIIFSVSNGVNVNRLSLCAVYFESSTHFRFYSISQEICTRFCCALLCCGYAIVHNEFTWSIYPYSSGLLCWHWGNR